ncbi:sodium-dependent transporter [Kineobactrum sediminis]|uniref:Sodium-dependent transporter n=1 Tax=Kineobactrum sediminis TaxID=1905677 RepID=A0A2N5XZY0_9GAMM|nr:sodium-dependent transporter [Kineobactrum sediminis]PLW81707.1 sodium-dependent transporter [Kineobactrum sediminis]
MTQGLLNPLGEWRSRMTFMLALTSATVGMGSVWRFSYLSGEYGGAPFVVAYVAWLLLLAVPLLIAELVLGAQGRGSVVESVGHAAERSQRSSFWVLMPWLACVAGVMLLALYTVVAGWALVYARDMYTGVFSAASVVNVGQYFNDLLRVGSRMLWWQSLFLGMVMLVVVAGVRRGLGLFAWVLVPTLLASLVLLVQYSMAHGDILAAGKFLFAVQPLDFNREAVLVALGQAFFTLGIGVGTGISFGSYAPVRIPIGRSVLAVALFDTLVAVTMGLVIFPLVFAHNLLPSMGPGLMFISLPYAFGNLVQGELFGALFFLLVALVALGACVAILEPIVGALKRQFSLRRLTAVVVAGSVIWLLAYAALSTLDAGAEHQGVDLFRLMDRLVGVVILPLVALATAVLVGWKIHKPLLRAQLYRETPLFFSLWHFLLRYIAPPAIALVLLGGLLSYGQL